MTARTKHRLILGAILCIALPLLFILGARERITTDVFSLLQDAGDERDAEIVKHVVDMQSRVIAIRIDGPNARELGEYAARRLGESEAISRASVADMYSFADAAKVLNEEKALLLFPKAFSDARSEWENEGTGRDFESWYASRSAAALNEFLASPESIAMSDVVTADPLLMLVNAMKNADIGSGNNNLKNSAVVLAETTGKATDAQTQRAVIAISEELRAEMAKEGAEFHATGATYFAQRSEALIRADVLRLNILMTIGLGIIAVLLLRSITGIIAIALPVLLSVIVAACALFGAFPEIYALSIGIGCILGGIAIDYPVHILLHKKSGEQGFGPAFARIRKPLFLGCASTVAVFSFLLFSDLPLIRQVGLLVASGLICCCALSLPCLEAFPPKVSSDALSRRMCRLKVAGNKRALLLISALFLTLGTAAFRLQWGDDLDTLQIPMPDLLAEDAIVREAAGRNDAKLFAITGQSLGEALSNAQETNAASGLANSLCTPAEVKEAMLWIETHGESFQNQFDNALEEAGFDSTMFEALFAKAPSASAAAQAHEKALVRLSKALPAGMGWMMGRTDSGAWIVSEGAQSAASSDKVLSLDTRALLRDAFGLYRTDTARLASAGFAIAALLILVTSGPRRGLRTLAIPLLSTAATLGIFGLAGASINLFHIVGLLLGFGLTLDYALFTMERGAGKASVRFSAITTLTAFAVLALSAIPAVRGLGLSVSIMVLTSLLQCELHGETNDEPLG